MNLPFSNPELIRNARIQLRPGRTIAAAVICAAVSITTWASIVHTDIDYSVSGLHGGGAVFGFILYVQIAVLLIGGGIFCLQAVHREKDLNTFDYQRVTRLTSFELGIGKLFGAPILPYFVTLCLVPVALVGAIRGHVPLFIILEAYFLLLLGSIAYHALALMVSVFLARGGVAVSIFLYLALVGISSVNTFDDSAPWSVPFLKLHSVSPFGLGDLIAIPASVIERAPMGVEPRYLWSDVFLGITIPHSLVLTGLYIVFICWFFLAITRNLKRDPSVYEIYSPNQTFLFVLYVDILVLGFFNWSEQFSEKGFTIGNKLYHRRAALPSDVEHDLFAASLWLFAILALILLRNRERVRRRVREFGSRAASWWSALWPAPYLVGGVALLGGSVIGLISHYRNSGDWNLRLAVYDAAFLAAWLARDALYFQWMNLRRTKHPLASAALYLIIFYVCTGFLFGALNLFQSARGTALSAIILPWPAFFLNSSMWNLETNLFVGALLLQVAQALVFAWLHRARLGEFMTTSASNAAAV
ncbi:MAG TPA: hypothetical protein VJO53_10355 [Candidatus Acidoferrales bacterium]|nr:hypothetical protein [Candidatus Acidoferrales bacterium]